MRISDWSSDVCSSDLLDLLGAELVSVNKTQGLVSFLTSKKYDAIRIQLKSGLATALSSVEVYQACGNSLLPVQPASGISSLVAPGVASGGTPRLEAGDSPALVAKDHAGTQQHGLPARSERVCK